MRQNLPVQDYLLILILVIKNKNEKWFFSIRVDTKHTFSVEYNQTNVRHLYYIIY